MAHAQKPDFVFRAKRTSPFNSAGWTSVQSTTGSRGVRVSGSNAGYTMFLGSVKSTGYPLHSPVSPSLPLPCVTVCHHVSSGLSLVYADLVVAVGETSHGIRGWFIQSYIIITLYLFISDVHRLSLFSYSNKNDILTKGKQSLHSPTCNLLF
jgi:hypothetical protein